MENTNNLDRHTVTEWTGKKHAPTFNNSVNREAVQFKTSRNRGTLNLIADLFAYCWLALAVTLTSGIIWREVIISFLQG